MTPTDLYIGLMSGTSLDAIDAVLVEITENRMRLHAQHEHPIAKPLKQQLLDLCEPGDNEIDRLGALDVQLASIFADAVAALLDNTQLAATQIRAIGSHGQTIRHRPNESIPFTLQIGDPNTLAELTGICVVADFRRRDIASGGQGAPLVPAFHAERFRNEQQDRIILNVGGMSNMTLLPKDPTSAVIGYDTGPGNVLLDTWIQEHRQQPYDHNGSWARQGTADQGLLAKMLETPFFRAQPPKSTGRELFNREWLTGQLASVKREISPVDVQATLLELTAQSAAASIQLHRYQAAAVYVCGGGARNQALISRLEELLKPFSVHTTDDLGLPSDWVEACAFAWLAYRCLNQHPGNLPSATGAKGPRVLGGIYPA